MARPHPHKRAARLAAISILSVLGAVVGIWCAPRVSDAVAAWMSAPAVELRTMTLPATLSVGRPPVGEARTTRALSGATAAPASAATIDAGMRFTMAGLTCAPPRATGEVEVLLRTSEDGQTWSRWYAVALERVAEDGGEEKAFTEPVWTGAGRYLQVSARQAGTSGVEPARLRDVNVVAINSTEDADRASAVVGVVRRAAAIIADFHLTPAAAAMTTKPHIVTRSEWGANESWRSGSPDYAPVKMAFVHHTDSGNTYSRAQAPAIVRGVYAYHTKSLHWSDVGYNFLIDRYGTVYEGRYGGVTRGVIGAQVLGFNTGSTGISVIGTFTSATPPSAAITSLERLLEWKLDVHHVDPQGTATLVCGYGQKFATGQHVRFPAIAGHRNANFTDCPGGKLYAQLPNIRKVVARTGQPKIYGFIVEDPAFSPNGDGVRERATIGFTVSQTATWHLGIRDGNGTLVWHMTGQGKVVETTWSGRDDDGKLLPDGLYTVQADATSVNGKARSATDEVRLDTVAPDIKSATVAPDQFSPNGDGQDDVAVLAFRPGEAGSARVSVLAADGAVLRRLTGWKGTTTAVRKVGWDGRITSGSDLTAAPEGEALLLVELRDVAGNTATARRKVIVDRTLKLTAISRETFSPNGDGAHDSVTLSFRLTHAADVSVAAVRSASIVRTLRLGGLAIGSHTVKWDGKLDGGGVATSGAYSLKVVADGALGVTSAAQSLIVDLAAPRVTAPATASLAYGKTAHLAFTARDAFSTVVRVSATITNTKGVVVATVPCGWVKRGVRHTCAWKPRARRTYTVTFRARDLGGNHEAAAAITSLRVR